MRRIKRKIPKIVKNPRMNEIYFEDLTRAINNWIKWL